MNDILIFNMDWKVKNKTIIGLKFLDMEKCLGRVIG